MFIFILFFRSQAPIWKNKNFEGNTLKFFFYFLSTNVSLIFVFFFIDPGDQDASRCYFEGILPSKIFFFIVYLTNVYQRSFLSFVDLEHRQITFQRYNPRKLFFLLILFNKTLANVSFDFFVGFHFPNEF
jgi:hypothetical protein